MDVSIKEFRQNIAKIADDVEFRKSEYVITRHGKPIGKYLPYSDIERKKDIQKKIEKVNSLFGVWRDRKDIKDPVIYAKNLRRNLLKRNERLFN